MTEIERIRIWMDKTGHTVSSLAKELGMSYDGTYQVLNVRKHVSNGFKFRFINCFGIDAAAKVFDLSSTASPTSTLPEETELVTK